MLVYGAARAVTTMSCSSLANVQGANPWTGRRPRVLRVRDHLGRPLVPDRRLAGTRPSCRSPRTGRSPRTRGRSCRCTRCSSAAHVARRCRGTSPRWCRRWPRARRRAGVPPADARFLAPDQALFAVVLFCVAPLSPMMQFGYAESLGFLLLALALLLLVERRYGWLLPVIVLVVHPARVPSPSPWRSCCTGRGGGSAGAATRSRCASACSRHPSPCSRGSPALAWPAIAWAATGTSAYTDTELAWRSAYIGYRELVPFTAWFQSGDWWLGQPLGTIAVVALIVGFALLRASPAVRRLGVDMRLWSSATRCTCWRCSSRSRAPSASSRRSSRCSAHSPCRGPLVPVGARRALPRAPGRVALICWGVDGLDWTPP